MKKFKQTLILIGMLAAFVFNLGAQEAGIISAESIQDGTIIKLSSHDNPPPPPPPPPPPHHHDDDNEAGDLIFAIWILDNLFVTFDEYPYANGDYILFFEDPIYSSGSSSSSDSLDDINDDLIDSAVGTSIGGGKSYRFEIETGGFAFPVSKIAGNETRLEGYCWKFFGPVFEHTVLTKLNDDWTYGGNITGNLRLGLQFSLIHSNWFDMSWLFQWTHWYGEYSADGTSMGLIMRSYPFEPILIEWRLNMQTPNYNSDNGIYESHLELGFMTAGPVEVYAAWKHIEDTLVTKSEYDGFSAGIKAHF